MKTRNVTQSVVLILLTLGLLAGEFQSQAQTSNNVTASGFTYVFNTVGGANPTLTLYRGVTYIFSLSVIGHPFFIKTNISAGTTDVYTNGVVNNGAQTGLLTFNVPVNAPSQLSYNCSVHSLSASMHGLLNIINPPAPPTGEIVLISLSPTGVTMKSLGATNWTAIPEFNSNLVAGAWAVVPGYTNILANSTNTTTFNRLDTICGSNVFLRIRNQFP